MSLLAEAFYQHPLSFAVVAIVVAFILTKHVIKRLIKITLLVAISLIVLFLFINLMPL